MKVLLLFILCINLFCQTNDLPGKFCNKNKITDRTYKTSGKILNQAAITSFFLINPVIAFENKNLHFGLTKALSAGFFPFGRAEIEYTYLFGNTINHHNLRLSYDNDIPLIAGGSSSALMLSPGIGYYSDLMERKGLFAQASIGLMTDSKIKNIIDHIYIKFRKTWVKDNYPDIFDISLGFTFILYGNLK